MRYWIVDPHHRTPLFVRAVDDPVANLDVVPEYFHAGRGEWVADEDLSGEMMWNPNRDEISESELEAALERTLRRADPAD